MYVGDGPRVGTHEGRSRRPAVRRWRNVSVAAFTTATVLLVVGNQADAAIVPTVPLLSSANFSVLGATPSVTNTGPSILNLSVGVSPAAIITDDAPPSLVVNAPGTRELGNAVAAQAQLDLTAAYLDAFGRATNDTSLPADLTGRTLVGGVYSTSSRGALELTGALTLDGQGDPTTVFIFQTDSSLTTASGSMVSLINGAQECNVFWQVGSSAALGTGSTFVGNILALTSITVATGATVRGRALARNGTVTLDTNTFTSPTCNLEAPAATTTSAAAAAATTTTVAIGASTTTVVGGGSTTTVNLPRTGSPARSGLLAAVVAVAVGVAATGVSRRRRLPRH